MGEKSTYSGFFCLLARNCLRSFCAEGEKKWEVFAQFWEVQHLKK